MKILKYFLLVILAVVASMASSQRVQYLSFSGGASGSSQVRSLPDRAVHNGGALFIELTYNVPGAYITSTEVDDVTYHFLHIDGFSMMGQPGAPALPAHNEIIAMPEGSTGIITILEVEYEEHGPYMIHPALEPARDTEGAPEPEFQRDESIYGADAFFPERVVEITAVPLSRETPLAVTQVRPVQFNPVTGMIRVYKKIRFRLDFGGGTGTFNNLGISNSAIYTNLLKRRVLNSESIPTGVPYGQTYSRSGAKNYIIITHSEYESQANDLANWKRQMGYSVEVVSQSSWTTTQINNELQTRYDNWSPKPDYFVIIGDHDGSFAVPGEIHTVPGYSDTFATDLYYACMDGGGDWMPDMAHGRIPASSSTEAQVIVDKVINYEKNPTTSSSFYQNGLSCAQYQDEDGGSNGYADRRFCHTSENIRDYLQNDQGYTSDRVYYTDSSAPVTTLRYNNGFYSTGSLLPSEMRTASFNWSGGSTDITTAINAGKFLVFHRDHGYTGGSGWHRPYYTTTTMDQLSNGDKLPVVFSINCHTGEYQLSNCFAEKFLRMQNKGAAGVIAAAYFSYSGYNDALAIGMIDAIWSDPGLYPVFGTGGTGSNYAIGAGNDIYTMGDVLHQGLYAMMQNWNGSATTYNYQYELFHWFGDPAMKIWTADPNPSAITATHSSSIDCSSTSYSITGSTAGAKATLVYNDELIGTATLDGSGNGTITYAITNPGSVVELTISKHNSKPYHSTLNVTGSCGFPPAVSTDAVTGIGGETATGNGEIVNDYGSSVTECGFVSGTDPNPVIGGAGVIQTITSPLVTSGPFSETMSGLSPSTSYFTRAYATNGNGTGYGGDMSFMTLCGSNDLPYSEDFSGGSLPNCWTQQSQSCTDRWSVESTNNAGGSANEMRCRWEEVDPATTRLVSPELNTLGLSSMDLSFNHYFDDWGAGATLKIQSSTDGVNWTDESWSYTSGSGNLGPETVNVSVTNNLNSSRTQVAFMITGNLYEFDFWYIDDVLFDAVYPGRWTGSVSSDWDNTSNWSDGQVPDETTDVVLSTGITNYPVLNGDLYVNSATGTYRCHSLTIRHGATLTFSSMYQVQVFGDVTIENGGTIHVGN